MNTAFVALCAILGGVIVVGSLKMIRRAPYMIPFAIVIVVATAAIVAQHVK